MILAYFVIPLDLFIKQIYDRLLNETAAYTINILIIQKLINLYFFIDNLIRFDKLREKNYSICFRDESHIRNDNSTHQGIKLS